MWIHIVQADRRLAPQEVRRAPPPPPPTHRLSRAWTVIFGPPLLLATAPLGATPKPHRDAALGRRRQGAKRLHRTQVFRRYCGTQGGSYANWLYPLTRHLWRCHCRDVPLHGQHERGEGFLGRVAQAGCVGADRNVG